MAVRTGIDLEGSYNNTGDSHIDRWAGGGGNYYETLADALNHVPAVKRKGTTVVVLNPDTNKKEEWHWPDPTDLTDEGIRLKHTTLVSQQDFVINEDDSLGLRRKYEPFIDFVNHISIPHKSVPAISRTSGDEALIREIGNVVFDPNTNLYIFTYTGTRTPYVEDQCWIYWATSPDLKSWTKMGKCTGQGAEDPYLIIQGGTYYLFVEHKDLSHPSGHAGVGLWKGTSMETLTFQGVVLEASESGWDSGDVSSPTIIYDDNTWYMFYEGRQYPIDNQRGAIGLATSPTLDGEWTKVTENEPLVAGTQYDPNSPVQWAYSIVPDDIMKINERYFLSFHAESNNSYITSFLSSESLTSGWKDPIGTWLSKDISGQDVNGAGLMFVKNEGRIKTMSNQGTGVFLAELTNRSIDNWYYRSVPSSAGETGLHSIAGGNRNEIIKFNLTSDKSFGWRSNKAGKAGIVKRIINPTEFSLTLIPETGVRINNSTSSYIVPGNTTIEFFLSSVDQWEVIAFGSSGDGTGEDGITPHIGENGNWFIGDEDTGIKAAGDDGYTPQKGVDYFDGEDGEDGLAPHVGGNGNWFLGEVDTGVRAVGVDGKQIELRKESGYIQWRYTDGSSEWANLINLEELKGEDGKDADSFEKGDIIAEAPLSIVGNTQNRLVGEGPLVFKITQDGVILDFNPFHFHMNELLELSLLPTGVRDVLQLLQGENRLDASAIKNLPEPVTDNDRVIFSGVLNINSDTAGTLANARWRIGGVEKSYNGPVTLEENDPNYERLDIIVGHANGSIQVITGVASTNTFIPEIPEGALLLHTILRLVTTGSISIPSVSGIYSTRFKAGPMGEYALVWETDLSVNQTYMFQLWYLGFTSDFYDANGQRPLNGTLKVSFASHVSSNTLDPSRTRLVHLDETGEDGDFVLQDTGNGKARLYVKKTAWNQSTVFGYVGNFSTITRNMLRHDQPYGALPSNATQTINSLVIKPGEGSGEGATHFTDLLDVEVDTLSGHQGKMFIVGTDNKLVPVDPPVGIISKGVSTTGAEFFRPGTSNNFSTPVAIFRNSPFQWKKEYFAIGRVLDVHISGAIEVPNGVTATFTINIGGQRVCPIVVDGPYVGHWAVSYLVTVRAVNSIRITGQVMGKNMSDVHTVNEGLTLDGTGNITVDTVFSANNAENDIQSNMIYIHVI